LCERALEAVDTLDDDDPGLRAEILMLTARSLHVGGLAETARQRALSAAALARECGDAARLAEAGVAYQGELGMWSSPSDAVGAEIMREGLAALGNNRADVRARALSALAHGLVLEPGGAALPEADAAISAAREAGDDRALCHALLVRAWAVRGVLPVSERLAAAMEAVETARAAGDRYHEISSQYLLGNGLLNGGDLEGAEAAFVATDFRGALEGWSISDFRASRALAEGRLEEAAALADVTHTLGTALGDTNDGIRALQRWSISRYTGDFDAAARWHDECAATAVGLVFPTAAMAALAAGNEREARELLASWVRDIQPLVPEIMRYSAIHWVSQLAFELDTYEGLELWPEYAERFPGELLGADAGLLGAADAARGRFAALAGDVARAVELLEAGHALHERLSLHQLSVESGIDLGAVLLRRDRPGDRARGVDLLRTTADMAQTIGMVPAAARARSLMA
jgi:hypothetical protein